MPIYRKNSDGWYKEPRSWWQRIAHWFLWLGGWENANGQGFRLWLPPSYPGGKRIWLTPFPISVLGHRLTLYGHWVDIHWAKKYLVINWREGERHCYLSKDGTPSRAEVWYWGAPDTVVAAVEQRQREADEKERKYQEWRSQQQAKLN